MVEIEASSGQEGARATAPREPVGIVLHAPRYYDLIVRLALGRERAFRERLLALAELRRGDRILDVGCGTGSLAILAKRSVGPAGAVCGLDASARMLARARVKARRAGQEVHFQEGLAQALTFPDATFDVVLSTMMLHHLPRPARMQLAFEARRVLKPAGHMLVVDFQRGAHGKTRWWALHQRHGGVDPREIAALLSGAGLRVAAEGPIGISNLYFVLATIQRGS